MTVLDAQAAKSAAEEPDWQSLKSIGMMGLGLSRVLGQAAGPGGKFDPSGRTSTQSIFLTERKRQPNEHWKQKSSQLNISVVLVAAASKPVRAGASAGCPLRGQKRTLVGAQRMSAKGHLRTSYDRSRSLRLPFGSVFEQFTGGRSMPTAARITAFESEAWRKHVAENPSPDLQAYLEARLNIDV